MSLSISRKTQSNSPCSVFRMNATSCLTPDDGIDRRRAAPLHSHLDANDVGALAAYVLSDGARNVRVRREGRHYSCRASGGGSVVLVDEASEPVAPADLVVPGWSLGSFVGLGRPEIERAVRP